MNPFKKLPYFYFLASWLLSLRSPQNRWNCNSTSTPIAAKAYINRIFIPVTVLAENNADAKLAPASLTKIMTVYVVFRELSNGHLHLEIMASISEKA